MNVLCFHFCCNVHSVFVTIATIYAETLNIDIREKRVCGIENSGLVLVPNTGVMA